MKKYRKILFGFTAAVGGLLGVYAFAGLAEYQMTAEVCSTLFHLPLFILLPMLFAPRFGAYLGEEKCMRQKSVRTVLRFLRFRCPCC